MSLIRWEPFGDITSIRQAMDQLFDDSFLRPQAAWVTPEMPTIDMYETDDSLVVKATLPGVKPEDVDISVTGDTLTVKGESKADQEVKRENYIRKERRHGSFSRAIALPLPVQVDKAQALYENGVLTLTLPKAEEIKPKSIKVHAVTEGKVK
ncbi:MAG: Hsp20/alpha crystallin family protein [Chloroflexi bacterium]|nr:Hsp20/alpha crystallin family protein [Chloroflexota bacterium]